MNLYKIDILTQRVSIQNSENSKFNDYHHDSIDKEWLNH